MLKEIKEFLESTLLEKENLSLMMLLLTSMFMLEGFWTIVEHKVNVLKGNKIVYLLILY